MEKVQLKYSYTTYVCACTESVLQKQKKKKKQFPRKFN